jgi:hypothetical protein
MFEKRRSPRARGGAAHAPHRRRCANDAIREVRRRRRLRLALLAAIPALLTTAIAPGGTSVARSAESPVERRDSVPDSTEDRVRDGESKDHWKPKNKELDHASDSTRPDAVHDDARSRAGRAAATVPLGAPPGASWSLVASPAPSGCPTRCFMVAGRVPGEHSGHATCPERRHSRPTFTGHASSSASRVGGTVPAIARGRWFSRWSRSSSCYA